jgi:hypothetical protein
LVKFEKDRQGRVEFGFQLRKDVKEPADKKAGSI